MWNSLLHVAEDNKGRIVGYVLAKMGDEVSNIRCVIDFFR
jgi:hypothetical protein